MDVHRIAGDDEKSAAKLQKVVKKVPKTPHGGGDKRNLQNKRTELSEYLSMQ